VEKCCGMWYTGINYIRATEVEYKIPEYEEEEV